ncbi:hypothetical protein ACS8FB_01035 [Psychrobacter sp. 1U1]|uniref:hypothetical protein n=1 Tax=Psychrobacter sp. 1U1 TaxID=3453576 RepID=UPI003F47EC9C
MQLRDDFAKHISELHNPIDRPYTASIDKSLLESIEDIEHLNKEIHDVNPDYLTFLPAYFWVFYFIIGWVYFSVFMFVLLSTDGLLHLQNSNIPLLVLDISIALFIFIHSCMYTFNSNPLSIHYQETVSHPILLLKAAAKDSLLLSSAM